MSKTILVTGANRGIGFEIALALVQQGHRVILACRDSDKGAKAADRIMSETVPQAVIKPSAVPYDLTDESAMRKIVMGMILSKVSLNAIVYNAAMNVLPLEHETEDQCADRIRRIVFANYFGTVATHRLFSQLLVQGGRNVFVASRWGVPHSLSLSKNIFRNALHYDSITGAIQSYVTTASSDANKLGGWPKCPLTVSKIGIAAYSRVVAQNNPELWLPNCGLLAHAQSTKPGITSNCCCPGSCATEMPRHPTQRELGKPFKSPKEGADTAVWLAASTDVDGITGEFFCERQRFDWSGKAVQHPCHGTYKLVMPARVDSSSRLKKKSNLRKNR